MGRLNGIFVLVGFCMIMVPVLGAGYMNRYQFNVSLGLLPIGVGLMLIGMFCKTK